MWYVIQTMAGKEQELVGTIRKMVPPDSYESCFFLKRQLLKRLGGAWLEITETLFPAYVFVETDKPEEIFFQLKKVPEFTKLLGDTVEEFIPLEESEQDFLEVLCRNGKAEGQDKLVKLTRVWLGADGKVERLDGPLEYFKGQIVRVNLRKRYAMIEIPLRGKMQTVLLGIRLEKNRI